MNDDRTPQKSPHDINLEACLRKLAAQMPGAVKSRLLNVFNHFDRAESIFDLDKEMASFRAITGEEEAATALIKATQIRKYPHSARIRARDHQHKVAVLICVLAIAKDVAPILSEFQLSFDFDRKRVEIKIPLSNFNVVGGETLAVQPVEPLDLVKRRSDGTEDNVFSESLRSLASEASYENIRQMVAQQANSRNMLLYASDSALPVSRATIEAIRERKKKALILCTLSVMVLQTKKHQSLVTQAIDAILSVISKMPTIER